MSFISSRIFLARLALAWALGALIILPALSGCGASPSGNSGSSGGEDKPGVVTSELSLGKVGALAKASNTINLRKLIVTLVSQAKPPDTVRDTSTISGNGQLSVVRNYTLKPLRAWTLSAKTLDVKDSMIHSGTTAAFFVDPADTVDISLNLAARFSMYEANFNSLPDSVASSVAGTSKEAIKFKRVILKVDGAVRHDSTSATYFTKGTAVKLSFDYISPGSHTVALEAHGELNKYSGILYSGSSSFDVAAGSDDTRSVTLNWAGPTTGTGKLTVTIGKVGKVVINGTLPGTVFN